MIFLFIHRLKASALHVKFGIPNRIPPDMGRYFSDTDRGIYCQKMRYTEKGVEEEEEKEEQ